MSKPLLDRYRANLEAHRQHVRDTAVRRGLTYLAATTDEPVERVVLQYFRERGLLG